MIGRRRNRSSPTASGSRSAARRRRRHRRLADAPRAHRACSDVGDVERPACISTARRGSTAACGVEAVAKGMPVAWVVDPLLEQRVPKPCRAPPWSCAPRLRGFITVPHVGDRGVVHERLGAPVSTSTSTSAKPSHEGVGDAAARVVVARHAHQPLAGERGGRAPWSSRGCPRAARGRRTCRRARSRASPPARRSCCARRANTRPPSIGSLSGEPPRSRAAISCSLPSRSIAAA
jgi:hypothetical protein